MTQAAGPCRARRRHGPAAGLASARRRQAAHLPSAPAGCGWRIRGTWSPRKAAGSR